QGGDLSRRDVHDSDPAKARFQIPIPKLLIAAMSCSGSVRLAPRQIVLLDEVGQRRSACRSIGCGIHTLHLLRDERLDIRPGSVQVGPVGQLHTFLLSLSVLCANVISNEEGRPRFYALSLLFTRHAIEFEQLWIHAAIVLYGGLLCNSTKVIAQ